MTQRFLTKDFVSRTRETTSNDKEIKPYFMRDHSMGKPILEVENLSVCFKQYGSGLRQRLLEVISNLSIGLYAQKIVAVVGSSGSGKSLLAHSILGILPTNAEVSGVIRYKGEVLTPKKQVELRGRELAFIPQSVNFLDPLMRVGKQVNGIKKSKNDIKKLQRIFLRYGLDESVADLFPFQLSGGMVRRILVASALISEANVIIADEPTPGMHKEVVKETMGHLRELADQGSAVMLITHDIESVFNTVDYIAVFYAGTTVEIAPVKDFSEKSKNLRHPYSKALWKALPENGFIAAPGFQPSPNSLPSGCLFEPRCSIATEICSKSRPEIRILRGAKVRCFNAS